MLSNRSKILVFCGKSNWKLIFKRLKSKRSKHSSVLKKDPTKLALSHFEKFYRPLFRNMWPSIRLGLLSPQKYCAVVNNYAEANETIGNLISDGASNLFTITKQTTLNQDFRKISQNDDTEPKEQNTAPENSLGDEQAEQKDVQSELELSSDLYNFMPTRQIGSEVERMKREEEELNMDFIPDTDENIRIIPDESFKFPSHLKAFAFERGDPSIFPRPRIDSSGKMDCYMCDAGSLLPVVALDLQSGDNVLDLCAAPGGKALTILETLLPSNITCVDSSYARVKRLKQLMKSYIPGKHAVGAHVSVLCKDAVRFCNTLDDESLFDKVMVDAPCYTDRHVLRDPNNNLFRPGRLEERLHLPKLQKQLLFGGISACRPGGIIVYSTCTLSPVQNDGVIQATLEKVWQETKMDVAVVDTKHMTERFRETYNFGNVTRYGQLVIPNITANFGPMYFCKLKRLS